VVSVLYVGFKGSYNSSNKLVNHFNGEKIFLTNSFSGLKRDIQTIDKEYEFVYMFGLDKKLKKSVRIEKCAEKDGKIIYTETDIDKLICKLKRYKLRSSVSEKPTHYLCNEAYYYMLIKMKCPVVFIHIPSIKFFTDEMMERLVEALKE